MRWLSMSLIFRFAQFGAPHAGGIQRHQDDAMKGVRRGVDQACDLFPAEDRSAGGRSSFGYGVSSTLQFRFNVLPKKKRRAADPLIYCVAAAACVPEQVRLIFADVLGTELVGRAVEIARQILDVACMPAWYSESNYDARVPRASFFVRWVTRTSL